MEDSYIQKDLKRGIDYIGVNCIFYCHDGHGNLLMHRRSKNCRDEQGVWDCGGGSMEFGETPEQAVRREVFEEYGVEPISLKFATARNVLRDNRGVPTHWIALLFVVEVDPSQVKIGEPEKMEQLSWFSFDQLPERLHSQIPAHFKAIRDAGVL
jgi:ADP-ribose pyrophosphatase YjhB (NUDIX family)